MARNRGSGLSGAFQVKVSGGDPDVSAGFKNIRIGANKRGHYIRIGRKRVYYGARASRSAVQGGTAKKPFDQEERLRTQKGCVSEGESLNDQGLALIDENPDSVIRDLSESHEKLLVWPISSFVAALCLSAAIWYQLRLEYVAAILGISVALVAISSWLDIRRKRVLLIYELDDDARSKFEELCKSFSRLQSTEKIWQISSETPTNRYKYHAGAGTLLDRSTASIKRFHSRYLITNVNIPAFFLSGKRLLFLPDKALIYTRGSLHELDYADLKVSTHKSDFVEDRTPPYDAEIVGHTWRYVNRDGSRDRRFNANKELPVARYDHLVLSGKSLGKVQLQVSRPGVSEQFARSVSQMR